MHGPLKVKSISGVGQLWCKWAMCGEYAYATVYCIKQVLQFNLIDIIN